MTAGEMRHKMAQYKMFDLDKHPELHKKMMCHRSTAMTNAYGLPRFGTLRLNDLMMPDTSKVIKPEPRQPIPKPVFGL